MQRVGSISPSRAGVAACALALLASAPTTFAQQPPESGATASTLDRIRETGELRLGYRADARPFSFRDASDQAGGYSVGVCLAVADALEAELGMSALNLRWVPVTAGDRFDAVRQGRIDLLCGAATETLSRRESVSFSTPIFPSGIGAMLRSDAPVRLQEVLSGQQRPDRPVWRGNAGQLLQTQVFAVIGGTTAESWLAGKLTDFNLTARVVPVDGYEAGIRSVLDREADVFFADRAILLDASRQEAVADELSVLDRLFTFEPVALALPHDDDAFRLAVDRALSQFVASGELRSLFTEWFGEPGPNVESFFRWTTLPE